MVKSVIKKGKSIKDTSSPKEENIQEQQQEENIHVVSSSDEREDEEANKDIDDEIDGLSDAQSDSETTKHKIKKLDPKKKEQDNNSNKKKNALADYSSIIYVSRLPHGFHEKELSKYFSQFGNLKEVRLARNKKTGNSRHYGFIEFTSKDDAKVAEDTMNNYLLMGHLLQVRLLPKGTKIEKLYQYKKRAFNDMKVKKSSEQLKEKAKKKHEERVAKLVESGIEFKW
ncbi:rRNA-binding ribosome biosynthesis protein NOP15 NDAI_0F02720 [Naumovozyma dairenensis CBS 421]|uniref:RRM domain-containing protein n=1 Tax=Naumovozyma dairenensis (strain ATCC 10597 / BCRC 20456 / CBS 421 / NBRC 0211 / NRRL Y-12639) TaxID=1071378 RepID=G0WCS9_NAUDC|nr:hypothetical protein NDAI_0F02720 [Naumovozyma dairenensis CBS 421]CCD25590.1 hypothetical protein NDAI_0F02720 [Naumovozyma dairenensis CBS 421]